MVVPPPGRSPVPPFPGHHAGSGTAGTTPVYSRPSRARQALILAVLGLLCCGLLAVIGVFVARSETRAIREGRTDPANYGPARVALVASLLATILWLAMLAVWVLAAWASVGAAAS